MSSIVEQLQNAVDLSSGHVQLTKEEALHILELAAAAKAFVEGDASGGRRVLAAARELHLDRDVADGS